MEGVVESARDPGWYVEREGTGSDGGFNNKGSRCFGCQRMFGTELASSVFCCADEDQVSHVKPVRLDGFVGALHVSVLIFAEDLGDVLAVS